MAVACLVVFFWLLTTLGTCHGDVVASFSIKTNTPSHVVDDNFISVTIDPASMLEGNRSKGIEKSLRLLKSLSPAYLQIAGPESNKYQYLSGADSNDTSHLITKSQWIAFNNMARIYGVEPIFCLNANRRQEGHWDPSNAIELIHFSDKMGYKVNWQLGCDAENLVTSLSGEQLGQDLSSLRRILDTYSRYEKSLIVGPDVNMFNAKTDVDYLTKLFGYEKNVLSAITLRLNSSADISQHSDFETVLVNQKKLLIDNLEDAIVNTPLWLADFDEETSDSTSDFGDALIWARKLGSAAKLGVQLVMKRPKLVHFQRPTPDYWVSFMYRTMVGRTVLEHRLHGNGTPIHLYSHCTNMRKSRSQDQINYEKGAITLYGVNTEQTHVKIKVKTGSWSKHRSNEIHQYIVTAANIQQPLRSQTVVMNGRPLSMDLSGDLPILTPEVLKFNSSLTLTLPGNSIVFWVIPNANVTACLGPIQEQKVPISLPVGLSSNTHSEELSDNEEVKVDVANMTRNNDNMELANEENLWNVRSRQIEAEINKKDNGPMQINIRKTTNGDLKGIEKLYEESNLKDIFQETMQQDHLIREINTTGDPVAKVITDKDWDAIKDKYLISKFMFVLKRDPDQTDSNVESPIANQDVITVSNDETFGQRFARALESGVYTIPGLDLTLYQPATFKNPLQFLKDPLESLKNPLESLKRLREERWEKLQMKKLEIPDDADPVQATMFFPGQLVLGDPKKGKENQEKNDEYVYVDDSEEKGDDGLYDEEKEQNGPGEMYEGLSMEKKKVRNKDVDYGELWEADKGLIEEPSFRGTQKEQEESTRNLKATKETLRHGKEGVEEKVKEKHENYETRLGKKMRKIISKEEKESEDAKERRRIISIEKEISSEESKLLEFIEGKYKAMKEDEERSKKSGRYYGDQVDTAPGENVNGKLRNRRHITVNSQSNNTNTKEREDSGHKLDDKDSVAKLLDEMIELTDVEIKHHEEELHLANSRNRLARHPQTTTETPETTTKNTKTKLQDAVLFIKEVIKERKESSKKAIESLKGGKGEDVTLTEVEVVANEKKADVKAPDGEPTEKNVNVTKTELSPEIIDTAVKTKKNEITNTSEEYNKDTTKRISLMNNTSAVKPLPQPDTHEFLGLENRTLKSEEKALRIKDDNIDLLPINTKSNLTNVASDESPNNDRNVRQSILNLGPNFQALNPVEAPKTIIPDIKTVLSDLRARINIPNGKTIPIQEQIGLDNMKNLQTLRAEQSRSLIGDSKSGIERTLEASRLRAKAEAEKAVNDLQSSIANLRDSRFQPKSNFKSNDLNPRLDDVTTLAEVSKNEIEKRIEESRLRAKAEAEKAVNDLQSSIANLKESRFQPRSSLNGNDLNTKASDGESEKAVNCKSSNANLIESRFEPRSSFKGNDLNAKTDDINTLAEVSKNEIEKRIEESRLRAKAEAEKALNNLQSSIDNLKEPRFQARSNPNGNDLNAKTDDINTLAEVSKNEIAKRIEESRLRAKAEAEKALNNLQSSIDNLKEPRFQARSNPNSNDLNAKTDDINTLAEVSKNEIEKRIEESRLRAKAEAEKALNNLQSSIDNLKEPRFQPRSSLNGNDLNPKAADGEGEKAVNCKSSNANLIESRFEPRSSFKGNDLIAKKDDVNTLAEVSKNGIGKRIEDSRLRAKAEAEKAVHNLQSSIANLKEPRFQPRSSLNGNDLNPKAADVNTLSEVKELENLGNEIKEEVKENIADLAKQTALMKELEILRAEILKVTQAARNNNKLEVPKVRPITKQGRNYVSKFRTPNERIPIVQEDKNNKKTFAPLKDLFLRSSTKEEVKPEIKVEQPLCEKSDSEKKDSINEHNKIAVNDPFEKYLLFNKRRDDIARARSDRILENQKSRARSFASSVDDIAQSMNKEVKDVAGQIKGLPNLVSEKIKDNNAIQNVVTKTGDIYNDIGKGSSKLVQEIKELPNLLSEKVQENAQVQSAVLKTKELMSKIDEGLKKLQSTPINSALARMQPDADKPLPLLPSDADIKGRFDGIIQKLEEINKDLKRSMNLPVDRRRKREILDIKKRKSKLIHSHRNDITNTLEEIKQKMKEIKTKLRRSLNLPIEVRKKREITNNNQPKSRKSRNHILDEEIFTANSQRNHKRYLRKSLDKKYGANIHAIRRRDTFRENSEGQYMSVYRPKGHTGRSEYEHINVSNNKPLLILEQNVNVSDGVHHWEVKMQRKQMMENFNKQKLKSTSDDLNSEYDYPSYEDDNDYNNKNYQDSSQYGIEYPSTNDENVRSYFDWDNFMMTDHRFDKRNALGENRLKKRTKRYIIGKKKYALNNKLNMIDFNEIDRESQESDGIEKTKSNEVMEKHIFRIKPSLNEKKLTRMPSVVMLLEKSDAKVSKSIGATNSRDKEIKNKTSGGETIKEDDLNFNEPVLTLKEISKKLSMVDKYRQDILEWSKVKENQIFPTPVVEIGNLKPDNESESQVEKTEILNVKENNVTHKEQDERGGFFKRFVNRLSAFFRI